MTTKRTYTIAEFCEAFSTGKTKLYEEIASGRLKSFLLGRKRLIASDDAENWLTHIKKL